MESSKKNSALYIAAEKFAKIHGTTVECALASIKGVFNDISNTGITAQDLDKINHKLKMSTTVDQPDNWQNNLAIMFELLLYLVDWKINPKDTWELFEQSTTIGEVSNLVHKLYRNIDFEDLSKYIH